MKTEDQLTETRTADQSNLHIARRSMSTSNVAAPRRGDSDSAAGFPEAGIPCGTKPFPTALPEANRPSEPLPIWLAVLQATSCEAQRDGVYHAVRWKMVSGRAIYTNVGREPEHIEPLGLCLLGGHTMAVSWMPGETSYTVEVYRHRELCA